MTQNFEAACDGSDYHHGTACPPHTSKYLYEPVFNEIRSRRIQRAFELGCGNGAFARWLAEKGVDIVGVDPSHEGIAIAKEAGPSMTMDVGSAYEDLRARFGQFPAVISLEVIEHVFYPRRFAKCVAELLEPGGVALLTTPFHGYWKNLAMAVCGRLDSHFTALWDGGHIKFWSRKTLTVLLEEQGLRVKQIIGLGRIPPLAKSMLAIAVRE